LVICFYYYLDQYQFKYGHTLRSQSSVSGADELDGPPLDSPGLSNGSETRATASSLLDRGAGKPFQCVLHSDSIS